MPLSLSKLYSLKVKKQEKREANIEEETNSENDTFTKLKKLSITPELAKQWVDSGCGKPC